MTFAHAIYVKAAMVAAVLGLLAASIVTPAHASEGTWRAHRVGLADATTAPQYLVYLYPRGSVTYAIGRDGHNCPRGGFFTDVSAYTWQGFAIGAQTWNARRSEYTWKGDHGRVSFDGITFHNGTHSRVLVGGWCD